MAYMLLAQLAAMELNVSNNLVDESALVYAPGLLPFAPVTGLNSLGFISIADLKSAANAELGIYDTAYSGDAWRSYQEALKNVVDSQTITIILFNLHLVHFHLLNSSTTDLVM
jgi:hypothetical protein